MINHELRSNALRHTMIELRASEPCTEREIAAALLDQCPGVRKDNLQEVADWAIHFLWERKIIQKYEGTQAYEIVSRLDHNL